MRKNFKCSFYTKFNENNIYISDILYNLLMLLEIVNVLFVILSVQTVFWSYFKW
jgi:hypothetical protein